MVVVHPTDAQTMDLTRATTGEFLAAGANRAVTAGAEASPPVSAANLGAAAGAVGGRIVMRRFRHRDPG